METWRRSFIAKKMYEIAIEEIKKYHNEFPLTKLDDRDIQIELENIFKNIKIRFMKDYK